MAQWPRGTRGQSLVFDRSQFTASSARSWATSHGFRAPKTDTGPTTIRIRQEPPSRFIKGTYRTISLDSGVQGTTAVPKATTKAPTGRKKSPARKRATKKPVSRRRSTRYKRVAKTVTRNGKRIKTHVWVLKKSAKK